MGEGGYDSLSGGAGRDVVNGGKGNDRLSGDDGADTLYGQDGHDRIFGGAQDDKISGGTGFDRLVGGDGNDEISGGNGRDVFNGGRGADLLLGWEEFAMRDIFYFAPGDTGVTAATMDEVRGFDEGRDKMDLRAFGDLEFAGLVFDGAGQGQVRYDGQYVRIDQDGDGSTDAMIKMVWLAEMTRDDFLL